MRYGERGGKGETRLLLRSPTLREAQRIFAQHFFYVDGLVVLSAEAVAVARLRALGRDVRDSEERGEQKELHGCWVKGSGVEGLGCLCDGRMDARMGWRLGERGCAAVSE